MRRLSVTTCPLEEGSQTVIVGYLVRSVYLKGSALSSADMWEVSTTEVVVVLESSLYALLSISLRLCNVKGGTLYECHTVIPVLD